MIVLYIYICVRTFLFETDGIGADLSRNVGCAVSLDMIRWEGGYWFSTPGRFFACFYFFVGIDLHTKKNQPHLCCSLLQFLKPHLPQLYHELTCSHNFIGVEGEEVEQDKNRGGVNCKGQGWIVGEYHKGGKKGEDEERSGGMFPENCG